MNQAVNMKKIIWGVYSYLFIYFRRYLFTWRQQHLKHILGPSVVFNLLLLDFCSKIAVVHFKVKGSKTTSFLGINQTSYLSSWEHFCSESLFSSSGIKVDSQFWRSEGILLLLMYCRCNTLCTWTFYTIWETAVQNT